MWSVYTNSTVDPAVSTIIKKQANREKGNLNGRVSYTIVNIHKRFIPSISFPCASICSHLHKPKPYKFDIM